MLLISDTIEKKELDVLRDYFQFEDILTAAKKAKRGLGVMLRGSPYPRSRLIKMYLTGRNVPGRLIGANMSFKNPYFKAALIKNIISAQEDLKAGRYRKIQIDP